MDLINRTTQFTDLLRLSSRTSSSTSSQFFSIPQQPVVGGLGSQRLLAMVVARPTDQPASCPPKIKSPYVCGRRWGSPNC